MNRAKAGKKRSAKPFREQDYPARRGYFIIHPKRTANYFFPPHYHNAVEIMGIDRAITGTVRIAGNAYPVIRDTVILIPPRAIHSVALLYDGQEYEHPVLKIGFDWVVRMLSSITGYPARIVRPQLRRMPVVVREDYFERFMTLLKRLLLYSSLSGSFSQPYPNGSLENAVADSAILVRLLSDFINSKTAIKKAPIQAGAVRRIIDTVSANYCEPLVLDDIARLSFVSKTYMCRVFKKYTGMSVRDYLNQIRIEHAKEKIRMGETSMTRLAFECGFRYPSYFSRIFTHVAGMSPKKWSKSEEALSTYLQ